MDEFHILFLGWTFDTTTSADRCFDFTVQVNCLMPAHIFWFAYIANTDIVNLIDNLKHFVTIDIAFAIVIDYIIIYIW